MSEYLPAGPTPKQLSREVAQQHLPELVKLANLIPEVHYTIADILSEEKPDGRKMLAKWRHSYFIDDGDSIVAFVMGYERANDGTTNYPANALYISELAVGEAYRGRGYARTLLTRQLTDTPTHGFSELEGSLMFAVQTNAAEWNEPVRSLYESFGFHSVGHKQYENRQDVVMHASAEAVRGALDV